MHVRVTEQDREQRKRDSRDRRWIFDLVDWHSACIGRVKGDKQRKDGTLDPRILFLLVSKDWPGLCISAHSKALFFLIGIGHFPFRIQNIPDCFSCYF